jgi:hypothetical protein
MEDILPYNIALSGRLSTTIVLDHASGCCETPNEQCQVLSPLKPRAEWLTNEGTLTGGQTSFGLASRRIWAWLPESRTLIVVDGPNGDATVYQAVLPDIGESSYIHARKAALLPDGCLLMDMGGALKAALIPRCLYG